MQTPCFKLKTGREVDCGGGVQYRYRSCSNPTPRFGGKKCPGLDYEESPCNTHACACKFHLFVRIFILTYSLITLCASNVLQFTIHYNIAVPDEFLWSEWGLPDKLCDVGTQRRTTMCGSLRRRLPNKSDRDDDDPAGEIFYCYIPGSSNVFN